MHVCVITSDLELLTTLLCRRSILESNLQIGVSVRRGVGGTCPARLAGRQLARQGLLSALLDPLIPVQTPAETTPPREAAQPPAGNTGAAKAYVQLGDDRQLGLGKEARQSSDLKPNASLIQSNAQESHEALLPQPSSSASCGPLRESGAPGMPAAFSKSALSSQQSVSTAQLPAVISAKFKQVSADPSANGLSTRKEAIVGVRQVISATELASCPVRLGQNFGPSLPSTPSTGKAASCDAVSKAKSASSNSNSTTPAENLQDTKKSSTGLSAIAEQWLAKLGSGGYSGSGRKAVLSAKVSSARTPYSSEQMGMFPCLPAQGHKKVQNLKASISEAACPSSERSRKHFAKGAIATVSNKRQRVEVADTSR